MAAAKAQFDEEQAADGAFQRQDDEFREWITADGSTPYAPEAGRYHLYISLACPWASRSLIVRNLRGLEQVISLTILDPVRDARGWAVTSGPGCTDDPVNHFRFLSEGYLATNPDFRGRVTVPALWDRQTGRMVNNSEDDLCRMFNDAFPPGVENAPDLFPAEIEREQAELSQFIYENVNNGVYEAGFATSQAAYERGAQRVFSALDELEKRLAGQRYLFGQAAVEADWRLFCTLIRFDAVYHGHFKCNLRRIAGDYPNLHGYMRDLYQQPGIALTVDLDHIKRHYYYTHDEINPTQVVPIGPSQDLLAPHGREALG